MASTSVPTAALAIRKYRKEEWQNGLCDCCSPKTAPNLFFMACCCPCVQYGKTRYRLKNFNNLEGHSTYADGACWLWYLLGCFLVSPFLTCLQTSKIRHKYNIAGNGCSDCLKAWCCHCCAIIQADKEVKDRGVSGRIPIVDLQPESGSKTMLMQPLGPDAGLAEGRLLQTSPLVLELMGESSTLQAAPLVAGEGEEGGS